MGIIRIIRSLSINKAHGHDDISIRMLKICDLAIIKPLSIIFRNCINNSTFPDLWKKSNICPIHKKGDKQIINNYRPVSLLPICGKIFERLIFNPLLEYLEIYKLLTAHQSGFQANDSCVGQLLSIVCNIYTAFDAYPILESHGVFLDISKAFDEVWHVGICDALIDLIGIFLENRFQRVVLNGQTSDWLPVKAGPLFFLIYINDLSIDIISSVKSFADDISLFSIIHNAKTTAYELNKDLQKIRQWAHQWKMSFNPNLNKQAPEVIFSRKMTKSCHPQVFLNNIPVSHVRFQKHLGICLHETHF